MNKIPQIFYRYVVVSSLIFLPLSLSKATTLEHGNWIGGFGLGFTADPSMFLVSPQMEYVLSPNFAVGPLVQVGFSNGTLFTGTFAMRYIIGAHPRVKPSIEAGLGLAGSEDVFLTGNYGFAAHFGMGFDYALPDSDITLGTMIRINFAPPLEAFFLSWPLIVARITL